MFYINTSVNISIYLTDKFLETISDAMKELGFNSRSEFFRTVASFYLKEQGFDLREESMRGPNS